MLEVVNYDKNLKPADLVITGEGRINAQSICGKAVYGVTKKAVNAWVNIVGYYDWIYSSGNTLKRKIFYYA